MKKVAFAVLGLAVLACVQPRSAFADITLQESNINVNGTQYYDTFSVSGLNTAGFDQTTGLGSLTLTYNPGPGTYFVTAYFDLELGVPFFNEYGTVTGSPVSGQSWQIDDPWFGTIFGNAQGNSLDNTNHIAGAVDNYLGSCGSVYDPGCANSNDDVSWAMGFAFTLGANQEEVITLLLSQTAPGSGFYLGQVHPIDPNNATAVNAYFSGSAMTEPISTTTPESGTWMLLITGLCLLVLPALNSRLRAILGRVGSSGLALLVVFLSAPLVMKATVPTVLTVPFVPTSPSNPHVTHTGSLISLGATASNLTGSADTYQVTWNFGDGTANTTFSFVGTATAYPYPYDISTSHTYSGAAGTTYTATVTVVDMATSEQGSNTYSVVLDPPSLTALQASVDVAIDNGLWYMHQTMWRATTTINGNLVDWGGWDDQSDSLHGYYTCGIDGVSGEYQAYDCDDQSFSGAIDASNVQAFEVSGHLETGPSTDPYTDDVARGLARMFRMLSISAVASKQYNYDLPSCPNGAVTPCTYTFDGNSNGQAIYANNNYVNEPFYQGGQFIDALVASSEQNGIAKAGVGPSGSLPGIVGQTYYNIVQDLVDGYLYCQYNQDSTYEPGGGWWYYCPELGQGSYDDNSVSQWGAIGLIAAQRGFGIPIPTIITDANNTWITNSQESTGAFAYSVAYCGSVNCNPWGPYADTPSGMVQMAMDGVGGTASGNPDQRWNLAESYYRDNFCNATSNGAYYAPRAYTYGLFSFTKAMLLNDPGGVLSPITYLEDEPSGANPIDWYNAQASAGAPCDGVAQTIVSRQNPASYKCFGCWFGDNYDVNPQSVFETAWSIIMLQKTVFTSTGCVNNLYGRGTPGPGSQARVDLTWSAYTGAKSYNVLRSTVNNGPYTMIGTTTTPAYSDRSGLMPGTTYYYVIQPVITTEVCQSNQATVAVPRAR